MLGLNFVFVLGELVIVIPLMFWLVVCLIGLGTVLEFVNAMARLWGFTRQEKIFKSLKPSINLNMEAY